MLNIVVNYLIKILRKSTGQSIFFGDSNNTVFQLYFSSGTTEHRCEEDAFDNFFRFFFKCLLIPCAYETANLLV